MAEANETSAVLHALDQVPALVAILRGPELVYEYVNAAYARIVHIDSPIGKPFGASGNEAVPSLVSILRRVYETGDPAAIHDARIAHEDQPGVVDERFFDVRFVPLRDAKGRIDGVMIHSVDVTELVRARVAEQREAELRANLLHVQKLESLGVLAGGIAHDFNNLLGVVLGSISAAALMLAPEEPAQEPLARATAGVRRASDLTRQLLAYAGKAHFRVEPIDLAAHVREIAQLLRASVGRTVALELEVCASLPAIVADAAQIQQLVMNLVINAAEAIGDRPGKVRVSAGVATIDAARAAAMLDTGPVAPGRYVALEVKDDGSGMDEATRRRIFDPFFTTKITGRGLGLASVLGIVRGHHGGIEVESAPGAGTTFRVFFPVATATPRERARAEPIDFKGKGTALVVDDDDGVRRVTRMLLEMFGFAVVEASGGALAKSIFVERGGDFAVVVVDMTMPDMNGEETFRDLRAIRPDAPVVVTSGYAEDEARRWLEGQRRATFLQKPFAAAELVRALREVLHGR